MNSCSLSRVGVDDAAVFAPGLANTPLVSLEMRMLPLLPDVLEEGAPGTPVLGADACGEEDLPKRHQNRTHPWALPVLNSADDK